MVRAQLARIGQFLVDQQIGDFLELARHGELGNIVAAIMQIIAGAPDAAQRRVARDNASERDGFLLLGLRCGFCHGSRWSRSSAKS